MNLLLDYAWFIWFGLVTGVIGYVLGYRRHAKEFQDAVIEEQRRKR